MVTGVGGFIAKHVAAALLAKGFRVRGTVRDAAKGAEVREALARTGAKVDGLELVVADLDRDAGWPEALAGVDHVEHLASPFPLKQPQGRMDLVPAAREGALRVLRAAAAHAPRVGRIFLTSSMVAMMYRPNRPRQLPVREADWTDADWPPASPYIVSKTLAERAAWDYVRQRGWEDRLVVINPGFVLGPAFDRKAATSLDVIKLFFAGAYPALPPVHFPVVDVRDLANLHVAALTAVKVGGRRLIGSADTLGMAEMAHLLMGTSKNHFSASTRQEICLEKTHGIPQGK